MVQSCQCLELSRAWKMVAAAVGMAAARIVMMHHTAPGPTRCS